MLPWGNCIPEMREEHGKQKRGGSFSCSLDAYFDKGMKNDLLIAEKLLYLFCHSNHEDYSVLAFAV